MRAKLHFFLISISFFFDTTSLSLLRLYLSLFVLREFVITSWIIFIIDALLSLSDKIWLISVCLSVLIHEWLLAINWGFFYATLWDAGIYLFIFLKQAVPVLLYTVRAGYLFLLHHTDMTLATAGHWLTFR